MSIAQTVELASAKTDVTLQDPDLSTIPPEYHEFADLFSKKEADVLPPHRSTVV
jgi:hypothetical protein